MKILVPIDFSENSIKALELALSLNRNQKSTIILVHIVELVYDFASQAAIGLDSMHNEATKLIDKLAEKYNASHLDFQKIIQEGTASITISRLASHHEADLIVIGTSGAGGIKKLIMGSSTISLLKETNVPTLVVPAKASLTQIRKLIMAIQFSDHEKPLLNKLITFKNAWGLEIDFIHVSTMLDFKEELACLGLATYMSKHLQLKTDHVINLNATTINEGINSYLQSNESNILVMCHQQKSFWKEFQQRSHSLAMTYQSSVPILVMN